MELRPIRCTIASQFIQSGVALPHHSQERSIGFNLGLRPLAGMTSAGITYGEESKDGLHYQPQCFSVKGELEVEIGHWQMEGAQTTVGGLSGHVQHLEIVTQQDSQRTDHFTGGLDTSGQISWQKGYSQSNRVEECKA